jgi:predicted PurR-regulated permease PerM
MFKTSISPRTPDEVAALVSGVAVAVLAAIIVGTLYFGREIFVPIALAILLSFVLAPVVRLLEDWHFPRGLSVVGVVLLAFLVIFGIGGVIGAQVAQLAGDLPRYQSTMREKIQSIRGTTATTSTLERAADVLQDLGKELDKPRGTASRSAAPQAETAAPGQEAKPIPVEVRQPPPTALESVAALISPLLRPLTTTGIIILFVVFILLQREDLRNRVIKLAGSHDLQKTTAALDDAARRLSRLYLTQLALNSAFGIVIGTGLWLIGVPNPVLWGILAATLRFVPYIGAFISALFPLALAAAVDPGWSMLLWTAALFLVVEPIVGHVIEPLVYGHSTGLSPAAVVVSATFWTALWGPIGLVLATPLTICLVVLGRHVQRLEFLDVMFGDRPPLSPPEIFYQRMLAGDPAEAVDNAEEFLKEKPLAVYYDEVALKGLKLAQNDVARESLDPLRIEKIKAAVSELVDDLADQDDRKLPRGVTQNAEAAAAVETAEDANSDDLPFLKKEDLGPDWQADRPVLCAAGRTPLDEAAAMMLAQLLVKHGLGARVDGADTLSVSNISRLETAGVAMVCLSYLDTSSPAHMRYTIRRVRRKLPTAKILLGCWMAEGDTAPALDAVKADAVATTFRDALRLCLDAARAGARATPIEAREAPVVRVSAASRADQRGNLGSRQAGRTPR